MTAVEKRVYGPISVVRNHLSGMLYASTYGPEDLPVIVALDGERDDSDAILACAEACAKVWVERRGGMPRALLSDLERVLEFRPASLLDSVRTAARSGGHGYTRDNAESKETAACRTTV